MTVPTAELLGGAQVTCLYELCPDQLCPLWVPPRGQGGPAMLASGLAQPHSPMAMALAAPRPCFLPLGS